MKAFVGTTTGVSVGSVSWNVTYEDPGDSELDVFAELYDANGNVQYSNKVPCRPPLGCPVVTDNVALGSYTAGLAVAPYGITTVRISISSALPIIVSRQRSFSSRVPV